MAVHRGGLQPPGTRTLAQLVAEARFAGIPTTTLRVHLAPARVGTWLPGGQTARCALYDAAKVAKLEEKLPRRRAADPVTRRRLRRRKVPPGGAVIRAARGARDGWVSVAQLAAELGREPRQVMRALERHDAELARIDRSTSELRTLRLLLAQACEDPSLAGPVPREKRVVDGRERWVFERVAALGAFGGGRPTEAMWRRWAMAKVAAVAGGVDKWTRVRVAESAVAVIVGWGFTEHEGREARHATERLSRETAHGR